MLLKAFVGKGFKWSLYSFYFWCTNIFVYKYFYGTRFYIEGVFLNSHFNS